MPGPSRGYSDLGQSMHCSRIFSVHINGAASAEDGGSVVFQILSCTAQAPIIWEVVRVSAWGFVVPLQNGTCQLSCE